MTGETFDLDAMCEQARSRLRRSIGIRTGIAKARIAEAFKQLADQDAVAAPASDESLEATK